MFVKILKDWQGQKAGANVDVTESVANALITDKIAEKADDPITPLLAKSMEGLLATLNDGLGKSIDGALKQFADAQTKSRKNRIPAIFGDGPGNEGGDPNKTFGKFLVAVRNGDMKALEEFGSEFSEWEGASKKTAMDTMTGARGGFSVPTEFHNRLLTLVSEMSVVRPRATVIPMSARTVQIPSLDHTTAPSSGDSAFLGGLVARWTEEAGAMNETEPNFKQVELTNYELSGYSYMSNALLQDNAVGLESLLYDLFARAIAWYEDYAFLRGNGAAKPLGAITWNGLISVTRSAASAFALADAAGMIGRLLPGYNPKHTCWTIHPTVLVKLFQMNDAEGNIIYINNAREKPQMTLFGLPVEVSEKVPGLNTAGDILLGDWSHYLIGDRQKIELAFSEHIRFTTNQGAWRFVSRVGGLPWLRDKVTLSDASNTLSPFVALAAG